MRARRLIVFSMSALAAVLAVPALAAADQVVRNGGVQLEVPDGWAKVDRAEKPAGTEPRTLLVVGTKGARSVESECLVASYKVPVDGAVVVVVGWRESFGATGLLPLNGLKLRRETFACFPGRGAVAQITRGGRDYQVSVMVGDKADGRTVAQALAVARSFAPVPRP